VFAVRPPRLQILRPDDRSVPSTEKGWQSEERDRLRLEITLWWKGVKDHVVQLEDYLEGGNGTGTKKKLPATPPEAGVEGENTIDAPTPKARPTILPRSSSSASQTSQQSQSPETSSVSPSNSNLPSVTPTSSVSSAASAPVILLGNLRQAFQATEQALYATLNQTPASSVNDVRRLFLSSAKAASKRLAAWQVKHASGAEEVVGKVYYPEPEWWAPGCHPLPGGSIVVREGEWASVIAFTLRCVHEFPKEILIDMCL
jgi:1-phosphatidylinositol-3-phosphate 5-kinase